MDAPSWIYDGSFHQAFFLINRVHEFNPLLASALLDQRRTFEREKNNGK